jgi:hypothetical protein
MGELLVGVEKIAHLVRCCNIYEALYRSALQGAAVRAGLEPSLTALYAVILQFLATAMVLFGKHSAARTVHAILHPDEVKQFLSDYKRLESTLESDASNCESVLQQSTHNEVVARLQTLLAELRAPLVRINAGLEALLDRSDHAQRREILNWVSSIPYESNHYATRSGHTPGTAVWILTHPTSRQGRASSAPMTLWLNGIHMFHFQFTDSFIARLCDVTYS